MTAHERSVWSWYPIVVLLPGWCRDASGFSVTWFRVSSRKKKALANNEEAAAPVAHRPGMKRLEDIGGIDAILHDSALRAEHGIVEVRRYHASPYAKDPGRLMGYLWPIEDLREVVFLIMESAALTNVELPGQLLPGNCVNEVLCQLALLPTMTALHGTVWHRFTRSGRFGETLAAACRRGGTSVFEGRREKDLTSEGGKITTSVESNVAEAVRTQVVQNTSGGSLAKLRQRKPAWNLADWAAPVGWSVDLEGGRVRELVADTRYAAAWTEFYATHADGGDATECGAILAKHEIPARGQGMSGKTYAQLSSETRRKAARGFVDREHFERLRTCTYRREYALPKALAPGEEQRWADLDVVPGGETGKVLVAVQLPAHGVVLTDAQWAAWQARLDGHTSRAPSSCVAIHPLSGTPPWWNADRTSQDKIIPTTGGYQIRRRTKEKASTESGDERGWYPHEGDLVASTQLGALDAAVGELLRQAGRQLHEPDAVLLPAFGSPSGTVLDAGTGNVPAIAALEAQISDAEDDVDIATQAVENASADTRQRRTDKLSEARQALDRLTRQRDSLLTPPAPEPFVDDAVDVSTLAALAGLLAASDGRLLPPRVRGLVQRLFNTTLRIDESPATSRQLLVSGTVHLATVSGASVALPVQTTVRNSHVQARADADIGYAVVHLVMVDGLTVSQAAAKLGLVPATCEQAGRVWLRTAGVPGRGRSIAALDCQIPGTKLVLYRALTDPHYVPGTDFERDTITAYRSTSGWPDQWAADVERVRLVLNVFRDAIGRGEDISHGLPASFITELTGVTRRQVMALTQVRSNGRGGCLARHPDARELVVPHRCPRCETWLLHVLWVPETMAYRGLLCEACRSFPNGDPIPPGLFQLFDAPPAPAIGDNTTRTRTVLADPARYEPRRPIGRMTRRVRMQEAARISKLSETVLRAASNSGRLRCQREGKAGERTFDVAELEAFAASLTAPPAPEADITDPDYLDLPSAGVRLRIGPHHLRALAMSTPADVDPLPYRRVTGESGREELVFAIEDLDRLDQGIIDDLRSRPLYLGEVALLTGISGHQVKLARKAGHLPAARVGAHKVLIEVADVDAWRNGEAASLTLLLPGQAAQQAQVSYYVLMEAVAAGVLPAHRTGNGRLRFDARDVDAWLDNRGTSR